MRKESKSNAGKEFCISEAAGEKEVCFCLLEEVIDTISKKWSLTIISAIGNKRKMRFNEILQTLKGMSPKTLADRLRELEQEGLIKREAFAEIPPRVEYSLTKEGIELRSAIIPLMKWASTRKAEVK